MMNLFEGSSGWLPWSRASPWMDCSLSDQQYAQLANSKLSSTGWTDVPVANRAGPAHTGDDRLEFLGRNSIFRIIVAACFARGLCTAQVPVGGSAESSFRNQDYQRPEKCLPCHQRQYD